MSIAAHIFGILVHSYINYLSQQQVMFCCSPQHLQLAVVKNDLDFISQYVYPRKYKQLITNRTLKHKLTKHSSLQIDSKSNYQFKIGHDKYSQILFQLCEPSKQICLTNIVKNIHDETLWRILGEKQSHKVRMGDKIKIGMTELSVYSSKLFGQPEKKSAQYKSLYNCRYCFVNTYTNQDPLLNLCKCSGSVKYLHLSCLRDWLMTKFQEEYRDRLVLYTVSKLECEICKQQWPKTVVVDRKTQSLLQFQAKVQPSQESFFDQVFNKPYIVFESASLDEDELQVKLFLKFYIDYPFYLGDSDSSDLTLQTYGVSGIHCFLHTEDNDIYITDCGSLAGTLVTMHQQQIFTNKKSLFLQYSQLILNISLEEPLFWCFTPEQQYKLKYKIQNK